MTPRARARRARTGLGACAVSLCAALGGLPACHEVARVRVDADAGPAVDPQRRAATVYDDQQPATGSVKLTEAFDAYEAADAASAVVARLGSGQAVDLVALRGGFVLVDWSPRPGATSSGWLALRAASRPSVAPLDADAGAPKGRPPRAPVPPPSAGLATSAPAAPKP